MQRSGTFVWRRVALQAGILAGIGLAFTGGQQLVAGPPQCALEDMCSFRKPLLMIAVEYGAAMNSPYDADSTRWEAAVAAVHALMTDNNGFMVSNFNVGLLRYGHDPDPRSPGTTIAGDTTGLVDGVALDVPVYDKDAPDKPYVECVSAELIEAALAATPAPNGSVGAWTRGALAAASAHMDQALADHPMDDDPPFPRLTAILLITQGVWTDVSGTKKVGPPADDPVPLALDYFNNLGRPTWVIGLGLAQGDMLADQVAQAGGTGMAYDGYDSQLMESFQLLIQDIWGFSAPICTPGYPRVMVLLDAGSAMLNDGGERAPPGVGGWEQARGVLASDGLVAVQTTLVPLADITHFGLAVYGDDAPAEERLLVQYGPCSVDNFSWAIDPASSCDAPGCVDAYAPPPIAWTFHDGTQDPPGFDAPTFGQVPRCDAGAPAGACVGSGSFLHRGLELVEDNLATYKAECEDPNAVYPCDMGTTYVNLLITDGMYASTDAQVQAPLTAMHAAGVTTFVLGVGEQADTPEGTAKLVKLAEWGSGGTVEHFKIDSQADLAAELVGIVDALAFDPCCNFRDCAFDPEPSTNEPDPVPGGEGSTTDVTAGSSTGGVSGESSGAETSSGAGESSGPGTGTTGGAGTTAGSGSTGAEAEATSGGEGGSPTSGWTAAVTSGAPGSSAGEDSSGGDPVLFEEGGCACATGRGSSTIWLWGVALLAGRRRSRHARMRSY